MKKNIIKKYLLLCSISLTLYYSMKDKYIYHSNYRILNDNIAYATYKDGLIYIGNLTYTSNIKEKLNEKDIIILDERNKIKDPSFKIISSYKIIDKEIRNDILEVLLAYEKEYPSNWNRTIESMRLEWYIHNILYNYNINLDRTSDVDLNNKDELIYKNKILEKILNI